MESGAVVLAGVGTIGTARVRVAAFRNIVGLTTSDYRDVATKSISP